MDFIVIGAGLFGSMTATALEQDGHNVTVVDENASECCSQAAGCLIKPSWLGGLSREKRDSGLSFLHETYAMREIGFKTDVGLTLDIWHLPPAFVLRDPKDIMADHVMEVGDGYVRTAQNGVLRGVVVVAAGVGCSALLPSITVRGLAGVSLLFDGEVDIPRIRVWAPYKQAVCFPYNGQTWFGDGTAIKQENWDESRVERSLKHAEDYFGLVNPAKICYGARPYVAGNNGLLEQLGQGLWVNTGGAKSGAVLAAAHAVYIAGTYNPDRMLG